MCVTFNKCSTCCWLESLSSGSLSNTWKIHFQATSNCIVQMTCSVWNCFAIIPNQPYYHTPSTFFGLAFPWVVDTQFIKQVKCVMVLTHTGNFIHNSLELAQLKVSIGTPTLESSYDDYRCLLTFCWIKVLWKNLWLHKVLWNPDQILPNSNMKGIPSLWNI
jgi:hypothetical protein